ncbi:MAG: gamma-glutamyl-gamma-aminobutyrate hydrolase family protein, partial [Bacilli bacterium]|nr:gamma-glutamyl-gamma-aminobutyrate hydrolase family protein [Bacilli bacterium]
MRKPIIGVILNEQQTPMGNHIRGIYSNINKVISENDGIALGIASPQTNSFFNLNINSTPAITDEEFEDMKVLIDCCNGIICQGGDDFFDYDLKVVEYCHKNDIPLLGICLGMQTMSCLFNGYMEDIGNDNHKQKSNYVHEIKINSESLLFKILNKLSIKVNSSHRFKVTKTDLNISAYSSDGVIEAV